MTGSVCPHLRTLAIIGTLATLGPAAIGRAQSPPPTFKVAFFNIQSGKGEPALPGRAQTFVDTTNCTDASQPMNAWGIGFVQAHLTQSIANDPRIVALGLAESWASVCGSPEHVRRVLGWRARTSERNGVAMVARYGFVGGEEWVQLDTSLNSNPADTMWVLRMRVCLDESCTQTMTVFTAHWYGSGSQRNASYDRQARQTVEFLQRAGGLEPHVFTGDLNTIDGSGTVCGQSYNNSGLQPLRDAGYVDAWPLLHGSAEGFTGMTNRAGCGTPEGYVWKRPDYTWAPSHFLPLSMTRFGVVAAGEAAPSDHFGIITEFPMPYPPAPPADVTPPSIALLSPTDNTTSTGTLMLSVSATDDVGVARVEILEDGAVAHTLTSAPYEVSCSQLAGATGEHIISARAVDAAGNTASSEARHVSIVSGESVPTGSVAGDIVLHARNAATAAGSWRVTADAGAAGGARMWIPDAGLPKLTAPLAAPADYFELSFSADAGRAYRIWMRGRADRDAWTNDSAFFQFSGSVSSTGAPVYRIGTESATWLGVEECSGCAMGGWGWQDNGYGPGVLGPVVYFAESGPQTLRVQRREDGLSIDQIVLSPLAYLTDAPGGTTWDTTILPATVVAPAPAATDPAEIVILASSATTFAGAWRAIADASAAGGTAVGHPDAGGAKLTSATAAPVNYVEFRFVAEVGRTYRLWLRGRADRDSWANDSIFVQFDGSIASPSQPVARIGTTSAFTVNLEEDSGWGLSGWGWQDNGYGAGVLGTLVSFETTGPQTMRIQTREDGLRIDQVVLSSSRYLTSAPGALTNDTTIVR